MDKKTFEWALFWAEAEGVALVEVKTSKDVQDCGDWCRKFWSAGYKARFVLEAREERVGYVEVTK